MQLEDNLEVDIILDMHWSEDEQVQTQSSGDTEILEEKLHTKEDIQSQHQKDKEEQGSAPQELVASQPLAETTADNQIEHRIKIREEVAPQEPTSSQSAAKFSMKEPQKEDVVTQEPVSPGVVDVVAKESSKKVAATQEPATLKIASNLQGAEFGTSSDKVGIDPLRNFIDLDSDKEEHHKE